MAKFKVVGTVRRDEKGKVVVYNSGDVVTLTDAAEIAALVGGGYIVAVENADS